MREDNGLLCSQVKRWSIIWGISRWEETDYIHGTVDDVIYSLWMMKDLNYVMRIMATVGRLFLDDTYKDNVIIWKENGEDVVKKFKYKMPFYWNFFYRHAVDEHNNLRHAITSFEDTWMIDR